MIKKNLINISIGLIFLFILSAYLFLLPKYEEFNRAKSLLEDRKKTLSQKEDYFLKMTNLAVKLDGLKEQLNKIETSLPEQLSEPTIINFLEKKSSENGLILESVTFSSSVNQKDNKIKNTKKTSFSIELSGAYSSLKNFLSEIYENERIFELEAVSFSSPTNLKDNLFKFKVNLGVYYFSEEKEEAMAGQEISPNSVEMPVNNIKPGIMP